MPAASGLLHVHLWKGERERERRNGVGRWAGRVRRWAHLLLQRGQSASSSMPATPMGNGNVPTNGPSSSNDDGPASGHRQIGPFWPAAADGPTTSGERPAPRQTTAEMDQLAAATIGLVILPGMSVAKEWRPNPGPSNKHGPSRSPVRMPTASRLVVCNNNRRPLATRPANSSSAIVSS